MFKKFWKFLNGKKRVIGIGLTLLGKAMEQEPDTAAWGKIVEYIGLVIAGGGAIHAITKKNNKP